MPAGRPARSHSRPRPDRRSPTAAGSVARPGAQPRYLRRGELEVQIFGVRNDPDTRKALRFFSDRRVRTHFVDLEQRAASKGELKRFMDRFGLDRLVDRGSKRLQALGLLRAFYGAERWLDILAEEPLLLRTPLVRCQGRLTVGLDEEAWGAWVAEEKG